MATLGGTLSRAFCNHMIAKANQPKVRRDWNLAAAVSATFKCVMHLLGFGALTYAGYTINMTTALVIGGISCFIFSWIFTSEETQKPIEPQLRR